MPCEHYKNALTEAAAIGGTLRDELSAHLAACACCRAAFAEEQSLIAAIDSGVHAAANTEVPPSLLPRVRASLDKAAGALRFRWMQPLVFASASVTLVLLLFVMARPHPTAPEEVAKQGPVTVPVPTASATKTNPEKTSPHGTQVATVQVSHFHASRNSTNRRFAASSIPEVLVPPDEREGLAQLVATLNEHSDPAAAFLAQHPEKKDALVTVNPLQISAIEIKPLGGTEAEASDGVGDKH